MLIITLLITHLFVVVTPEEEEEKNKISCKKTRQNIHKTKNKIDTVYFFFFSLFGSFGNL